MVKSRHYPPRLLERIDRLAELDPNREICGFVVAGRDGELEVVPVPNAADRYHQRDPDRFPRTSRNGYLMDPLIQLKVFEATAAGKGRELVAVYHSHVDSDACFSTQDQLDAAVEGRPMVPGAEYLVVSVRKGIASGRERFVWNGREFEAVPL